MRKAGTLKGINVNNNGFYQYFTIDGEQYINSCSNFVANTFTGWNKFDVDTLTTLEQVTASTDVSKPVGAGAVQELNSSLTWKFLGSINGNDEINIPENATELSYTINESSGLNLSGIIHLNQYSKLSSLEVGSVWMVTDGGNYGFGGNISLANGKYKINEMWNNYSKTNITASCISNIYYR